MSAADPDTVLRFWSRVAQPAQWFKVSPDFDRLIADRFGTLHARAA